MSLLGKEPPQNVFQHPGDVALTVVVRKAAAKRNRANRENRIADISENYSIAD
jgi:hypothetical protein